MAEETRGIEGDVELSTTIDDLIIEKATMTNALYSSDVAKSLNVESQVTNTDAGDRCLNSTTTPSKPTGHESLECLNEGQPNGTALYTRSKSLELFYRKSLANLRTPESDEGESNTKQNNTVFNSASEENGNDGVGLWGITKKLNAYERSRSHASMEELSRCEGEGKVSFESPKEYASSSEDESETSSEMSQVDCWSLNQGSTRYITQGEHALLLVGS